MKTRIRIDAPPTGPARAPNGKFRSKAMRDLEAKAFEPRPQRKPDTGTATVTIACKHPPGLVLQICYPVDTAEVGPNGPRTVQRWFPDRDNQVLIAGPALSTMAIDPNFRPDDLPIVSGGYALTTGVSKDFWERWLDQNKDTPLVKNKLIFAKTSMEDAVAKAKDGAKLRTGMEPIDKDAPTKRSNGEPIPELGRIQQGTRTPLQG